jgi:Xaa-Pro aminopeptidase
LHTKTLLALLLSTCIGLPAARALPGEQAVRPNGQPQAQTDRSHKCGLGAAFHAGRRAALLAKLGEGVVLVRGMPPTRDYSPFRQDKTFWYLTGVESPDAALLMDAKSGKQVLFLPKQNKFAEIWEGEIWDTGDAWLKEVTGFEDVRPIGDLVTVLKELTLSQKVAWISTEPHVELAGCADRAEPYDHRVATDPLDGRTSREKALREKLEKDLHLEVRDLSKVLNEMRRVKTPEEIDALRRAAHAGAAAMAEAMRSTRPGIGEWQIDALMTFIQRREGADGPAYQAIVGSGPNSLVLHYSACSRVMNAGEVLLVDYAPEFDHYTSDITRSWPVDGKLTPRMEEIYDAVFAAQQAGIAAVKPGKTIGDVEKACRDVLESRGLLKLMPHGTCHYVGMEVHDVGDSRKPFEPGVVFTVEPGVYEPATGIGVRIEDVVAVTSDGCEVLSAGVPKDKKGVLELCGAEGILDREGK